MSTPDHTPLEPPNLFAGRMSELMRERELSYRALAKNGVADHSYLHKLSTGERPPPGPKVAAAIDKALDAGGELVELARRATPPPARPRNQPLSDADAANVRATTSHLVALDTAHGSEGLTGFAVNAFRSNADRLAVAGGNADVRSAVADLGAAAAWIASDAVQRDESRTIALEALALADMAGDTRMHRFLLSHLSMVSEHGGRHGDALAYAERLMADQSTSPRIQAMIQVRRARALSGLGATKDALDAWEQAEHLLTESPATDDGLTYWIHDAEMAVHKAVILTRAGNPEGYDWARRGLELLPDGQGRDQVLWRAILLYDAVAAHAWAEVPVVVDDLLRYAGSPRSARVPEQIEQAWKRATVERAPAAVRDAVRAARDAFPR